MPALDHATLPSKQLRGRDASTSCNKRHAHARLHGFFHQPDLLGSRPSASALHRGDDFNPGNRVIGARRHSRNHRPTPMPYQLCRVSGRKRGQFNLIGATTLSEYQKHIEKDAALERRFQPVLVPEPTIAQTIMILRGLRDTLEAHHKVAITDEAIAAAAELSDRYITGRFLPDKAIDL